MIRVCNIALRVTLIIFAQRVRAWYTHGTFAERYRRALVIFARGCPFQGMEEWRNKGVLLMGNTNQ